MTIVVLGIDLGKNSCSLVELDGRGWNVSTSTLEVGGAGSVCIDGEIYGDATAHPVTRVARRAEPTKNSRLTCGASPGPT